MRSPSRIRLSGWAGAAGCAGVGAGVGGAAGGVCCAVALVTSPPPTTISI